MMQRLPLDVPLAVAPAPLPVRSGLRRLLRPWCLAWAIALPVMLVCILRIDHPLALILLEQASRARPVRLFVRLPEALAAIGIAGAVGLGAWRALAGPLRGPLRQALFACLGLCVALAAKTELKLVFGRVAPEGWFWHQSAPLRNFHMLHAGSFPSGHMAVLGVLTAFVWAWNIPSARVLWLALCLGSGAALMMMGAHFLSDLIAGALLGVTIGAACRRIAKLPG